MKIIYRIKSTLFVWVVCIAIFTSLGTARATTIFELLEEETPQQPAIEGLIPMPPVKSSKDVTMKSVTVSGKYDFESKNGAEKMIDLSAGFAMRDWQFFSKYFVPELKIVGSFKDNDSQTNWNTGLSVTGYGPVIMANKDFKLFFPYVSVGGGYQDANNAKPSFYYVAGGGIDIPTHIAENNTNLISVIEVGYSYYHASRATYFDNNQMKNYDEMVNVALKIFWK